MTILEDLKTGRLVVVPSEATRAMIDAGRKAIADERARVGLQYPDTLSSLAYPAMLTASPDHTAALVALVEGMREQNGALLALREKDCADYVNMAKNAIDNLARALAAEAERDALREALAAADAIRVAQRRYMADRGNEELGKAVGAAVVVFDEIRARQALKEAPDV